MSGTKFNSEFSEEVWRDTYKYHTDESVSDTHRRVARELASAEEDPEKWEEEFYDALSEFKNVPGGRITSNAGTGLHGTTFINCFVDGPAVEDKDSVSGIFDALTRAALTLKSEGGYGFCADFIRPRGAMINGVGVETPGAVEMLKLWDTMSEVITKGSGKKKSKKEGKNKIRKGAMMVTLSCWHPDIEEFITAKSTPGVLTKFNMSGMFTDDFMEAVKKDLTWELIYPVTTHEDYKKHWDGDINAWKAAGRPVEVYKEIKATDLWNLVMESTYNRNEPGILFIDRINNFNNLKYCETISATNPCVTGDTMVAVADGRGEVSFKQLAEEGKDVPVYCVDKSGKLVIRMMRNPRITGYNQKIYSVRLDDGSKVRVTGNHKFLLTDGKYVEAKDLKYNDSLFIMTKFEATIKDVIPTTNANSQDYIWINTSKHKTMRSEHRYIAEFSNNTKIEKGYVVHHKDYNAKNNRPENLQIMSKAAHDELHSRDMLGDKNPMVIAKNTWTDEQWRNYKGVSSPYVSSEGENNGKFSGITNEELKEHALILTRKLGRRFGTNEWKDYAKENNLVEQFSNWRLNNLGGSIKGFSQWAAVEAGYDEEFSSLDPRLQKTFLEFTEQGFDCKLEDNKVLLKKKCEICNGDFWVWSQRRETCFCSAECTSEYTRRKNRSAEFIEKATEGNRAFQRERKEKLRLVQIGVFNDLKVNLGRIPLRKEWEEECKGRGLAFRVGKSSPFKGFRELAEAASEFNHRVVAVEECGTETVYNGTVDEVHNYFIGGFSGLSKRYNKPKTSFVNTMQCGEQLLPKGGVCLLGSINLTQFVNEDMSDWDYDKLAKYIPIFVRFLDNVNDKTAVPLPEQKWNLQNKRRIGLGYLGYGSALYMMKIRYGSEKALDLTDKLSRFVTNEAYKASAYLAKEKGAFPLFNKEEYLKSAFIKQALDPETIALIKKYGLRNSHLTSIQPTGNSSIYANNVSSGLEPVVSAEYVRTAIVPIAPEGLNVPVVDWVNKVCVKYGDGWTWTKEGDENILVKEFEGVVYKIDKNRGLCKESKVRDYAVSVLSERGEWDKDADWAVNIFNLSIKEHVDTMKVFARYIDSAMSKTINIPFDYSFDDFKSLYMDMYDSGVIKGGTTYRHGTMTSVISAEATSINKINGRPEKIVSTESPKRPDLLPCEIHHAQIKGTRWTILVGLLHGQPYELFVGHAEDLSLPNKCKSGKILKRKQGCYDLHVDLGDDELIVKNITKTFSNSESAWATRIISAALRHGTPLQFLISSLNKEGNMGDINKVIARLLKKYIDDGQKVLTSEVCGSCGSSNLIYQDGCVNCLDCGVGKC